MKFIKLNLIFPAVLLFSYLAYGQSGTVYEKQFTHGDSLRTYYLYVPSAYDGQSAWPLILNFHGWTSNAAFQMEVSDINAVADTAHFLVAYPQGLYIERTGNDYLPNWIPAAGPGWSHPGFSSKYDDIDFTSSVIDHIAGEYSVDLNRVHATGLSMGGVMAFYLGCRLPDKVASVAGVAGHLSQAMMDNAAPGQAVSAIFIHGTADPVFNYNGEAGKYPSVPAAASFWASQGNCSPEAASTELANISTTDGSTVTMITYTGCDGNSEVRIYRVNNGGHVWPGPKGTLLPEALGNVNMDINAASEIVNFFKQHPLNDPASAVTENESAGVSMQFNLMQNYPNPFNPLTTFRYQLSRNEKVTLKIFDITGKEVVTLVNWHQPAGEHKVLFNASALVSGAYFYRLQTGSGLVQTKRFVLLK